MMWAAFISFTCSWCFVYVQVSHHSAHSKTKEKEKKTSSALDAVLCRHVGSVWPMGHSHIWRIALSSMSPLNTRVQARQAMYVHVAACKPLSHCMRVSLTLLHAPCM